MGSDTMMANETRLAGTIKAMKPTFGFILGADGQEYFFHGGSLDPAAKTKGVALMDVLRVGDSVTFEPLPGDGGKGPRAAYIRKTR